MNIIENKNRFMELARNYIPRDGIKQLLAWLEKSDFFVAPATSSYNLPVEGGLCRHALNVTELLIQKYYGKSIDELTEEDIDKTFESDIGIDTIFLVGLMSHIHKANCYVKDFKNVKVNGKWEQQEYWRWNENFTFSGRGSKSVFILQQYMNLYIEEAQSIAFYLAGEDDLFSNINNTTYRKIYENSRLALYLHLAEIEATYYTDNNFI